MSSESSRRHPDAAAADGTSTVTIKLGCKTGTRGRSHFGAKMKIWILAVSLAFVSVALAGDSVDSVLGRLARVGQFAFGGTGYAGVISQGEKDYRVILSRPSAEADFETLFAVGNPQGKSYALVGIRALDPSRFKKVSAPLRDSGEEVVTQTGCIIYHESLGIVLRRITAGDYAMYSRR